MYNIKTWLDCLELTGPVLGVSRSWRGDDDGLRDQRTLNREHWDSQSKAGNPSPVLPSSPGTDPDHGASRRGKTQRRKQGGRRAWWSGRTGSPIWAGGLHPGGRGAPCSWPSPAWPEWSCWWGSPRGWHAWLCVSGSRLQPPATSVVFPLSQCPHSSPPTILRDTISTAGPSSWSYFYNYYKSSSFKSKI